MMLSTVLTSLLGVTLLSTSTLASPGPLSDLNDGPGLQERQTTGFTPVTGVQTGGIHPRLEIRQLYNTQPLQWNLYLLAMKRFQALNQTEKLSYYQIAGIHGVPNIPWDGVPANPSAQGAVGYCTHSSVLFPAWHRPFLALFEQVLFELVQTVASQFPAGAQNDAYVAAARTFRIPYWDWAAAPLDGQPTMPILLTAQYATVNSPNGQQKTILNPLFRYNFHPLVPSDMIYSPWSEWKVTKRWPTSNSTTTPGSSQNDLAVAAIENTRVSRRDSLYQMYTLCSDYLEFSNDVASSSTPGCSTSLESIHNQIHSLTGGSNDGHMTWLWWSAFDPIFFIHHTNVDRLFAMWQVLYPNSYGAYQTAQGSTFTIAQGSLQGPNSPLTPFHANSAGTFWTTNSVQNINTFGYTYPEVAASNSSAAMMAFVNNLYGPNAVATAGSIPAKRDLVSDISSKLINPATGNKIDYIANIVTSRFALNGSYTIYLFMGNPAEGEVGSTFPFASNLIGSVSVFANPFMMKMNVTTTGTVPLTSALKAQIRGGLLSNMNQIKVIPFLAKALQWRVADSYGSIHPNEQVPDLQVSVVTSEYKPPASNHSFPVYNAFDYLPDITNGKVGGLRIGVDGRCPE